MFCVECGREGELIGSLCRECYSKRHKLVTLPEHVDLRLCAHCSSMETRHGWEDVGSVREAVERAVEEALVVAGDARVSEVRVRLEQKDERNLQATVDVAVSAHGVTFERRLTTVVRLKQGSCDECSRQQGKYYEAILQVRGPERSLPQSVQSDVERLVKDRVAAMRKSSRDVFISKIERVRGGMDFYFSTVPAARAVARELQEQMCAEFKESSSLWGRRGGRDVYRMTFMVRFQGFAAGDVIAYEGGVYYAQGLGKGVVRAIDLATGESHTIRVKGVEECSLLAPRSAIKRAIIVAESEHELQVLDPETMETVEVRKPSGFSRKTDQVRLVKTKAGTFILSDSW